MNMNLSKMNPTWIIWIMTFGTFGILSTELGFIGILPQVANFFSVSIDQAGLFLSCFSLIIAVGSLFIPIVVSKYNRRHLFILVLGVMTLFSFIGGLMTNFYLALLCRIIPAFFYPAYVSLTFTVAGELVPSNETPKAVSKLVIGVSAGSIFGVPLSTIFANYGGYPWAMFFFGFLNFISLIVTILFFPSIEGNNDVSLKGQLRHVGSGVFILSCIGVIIFAAGFNTYYSYASAFLQGICGIIGSNLSLILFIYGIMSIPGSWLAGRLLIKYPLRTVVLCPLLICVNLAIFYFVNDSWTLMYIFMATFGVLEGIFNNIIQFWIFSSIPEAPEFANGVFMSMLNIGITIGTFIGGLIIVDVGMSAIIIGAIIILIISMIFFIIRSQLYPNHT